MTFFLRKRILQRKSAYAIMQIKEKQSTCCNRYPAGITDRRLARTVFDLNSRTLGKGRLFLCLSVLQSDHISDAETCAA